MRRFTRVVRHRLDEDLFAVDDLPKCLEHDHCPLAADYSEEFVFGRWPSKGDFKTQHVAIERECGRDVRDDEER